MYHDQVIDDYEKRLAEKHEHIDALAAEVAELQAKLDRVRAKVDEAIDLINEYDGPDAPFEHHWKWANVRAALTGEGTA